MPQGQQTCAEIQWAIVRLCWMMDPELVAAGLNVSTRTVQRIQSYFDSYGTVPNESNIAAKRDRSSNQHLQDIDLEACILTLTCSNSTLICDVQYLLDTIQKMPDLYLNELQEMMTAETGVWVSCATIWRTLRRKGFTMKKVSAQHLYCVFDFYFSDHTSCG